MKNFPLVKQIHVKHSFRDASGRVYCDEKNKLEVQKLLNVLYRVNSMMYN